jgi:hypothetical protein
MLAAGEKLTAAIFRDAVIGNRQAGAAAAIILARKCGHVAAIVGDAEQMQRLP